jgi:hypothetical protein
LQEILFLLLNFLNHLCYIKNCIFGKIYKDKLGDKKNLKFSFLDDLKFTILHFIVPANENIKNITKLISPGLATSAHARE